MAASKDLGSLLDERSWNRRGRLRLLGIPVIAVAIAAAAYFAWLQDEDGVAIVAQPATAELGQVLTTLDTTGTVEAAASGEIAFFSSGEVSTVDVTVGETVVTGQVLATLVDPSALRDLERAEIQLAIAELRLQGLIAPPADDIAAADQARASAQSQADSAERSLSLTLAGPTVTTIGAAELRTAQAQSQVVAARSEVELLLNPSRADVEGAEQAVASAAAQLIAAERGLEDALQLPDAGDFAAADQAVASALLQLQQAQDSLTRLVDGPTEQDVAEADASLLQAETAVANAETSVRAADANVGTAWANLLAAQVNFCQSGGAVPVCARGDVPLSADDASRLTDSITQPPRPSSTVISRTTTLLQANASYLSAIDNTEGTRASLRIAETTLVAARASRAELDESASETDLLQATVALGAAEGAVEAAEADRAALDEPITAESIREAELAVTSAVASLAAARDRQAAILNPTPLQLQIAADGIAAADLELRSAEDNELWTKAGPDAFDVEQAELAAAGALAGLAVADDRLRDLTDQDSMEAVLQRYEVRLAQLSLAETQERVTGLQVTAPREGVVGGIFVRPGDSVTAGQVGFVVSQPSAVQISLTITEADFQALRAGQLGTATFDALGDGQYIVRLVSVGTVPNVEQGIVTYPAAAEILSGDELSGLGPELGALLGGAAAAPGLPAGAGGGGGFGGEGGGGFGGEGGAGGPFGQIELPEGVTFQDLRDALLAGELPEGVVLPDGLDLDTLRQRFSGGPGGAAGGGPGGRPGGAAGGGPGGGIAQAIEDLPSPVVGMTANVTILLEVRGNVLLVPSNAIRTEGQTRYVVIETELGEPERRTVTTGATADGNTEILSGLAAGETVLIGGISPVLVGAAVPQPALAPPAGAGGGPAPGGGGFGGGAGGGGFGAGGGGGIQ